MTSSGGKVAKWISVLVVILVIAFSAILWLRRAPRESRELAPQTSPTPATAPAAAATTSSAAPAGKSVPAAGEELSYRISWSNFATAATATIRTVARSSFEGQDAWELRAGISTANPVRALFTIDDEFVSWSDARTFASQQYQMDLHELGKQRTETFYPGDTGAYPAGTCDPLGALLLLRTAKVTGPLHARVFDGKQVYEMIAQPAGVESIRVPAGQFSAQRVDIGLQSSGGTASPTKVSLWLTQDASRVPIQIRAELPFGSLMAELTSIQPGR